MLETGRDADRRNQGGVDGSRRQGGADGERAPWRSGQWKDP